MTSSILRQLHLEVIKQEEEEEVAEVVLVVFEVEEVVVDDIFLIVMTVTSKSKSNTAPIRSDPTLLSTQ